jgi:hypothetical protein
MQHSVTAHADHIAKLKAARKPILAIAELVWNAFDADARRVDVVLTPGKLGVLDSIEVIDDGHGMSPDRAKSSFSGLGGSWKRMATRTEHDNRAIHGKEGRGRFKALGLGRVVDWFVCYPRSKQLAKFQVQIVDDYADKFDITPDKPEPAATGDKRGVRVRISEIYRPLPSLERDGAVLELTQNFAIYLRKYKSAKLFYNNEQIDPASVEEHSAVYPIDTIVLKDGLSHAVELEIVEWKVAAERRLYLCDADGFPLDEMAPGIQAPGFTFSAYLKSTAFKVLENEHGLGLGDLAGR